MSLVVYCRQVAFEEHVVGLWIFLTDYCIEDRTKFKEEGNKSTILKNAAVES